MRKRRFSAARATAVVIAMGGLGACATNEASVPSIPLSVDANSVRAAAKNVTPSGPVYTYQRLGLNCGGCKVTVTIQGVAGSEYFDPAHPPTTPQPVAHVVNEGSVATQMYGFLPHYDAYFTVVADSTGAAVWDLVQYPHAGAVAVVTHGKGVHPCLPPHAPKGSYADFQTCNGAHHIVRTSGSILELASRGIDWIATSIKAIAQPMVEDPGWFSCTDGCCTLGT